MFFQNSTNKKADFRCDNKLGAKDHLIEWRKPARAPMWLSEHTYAQLPEVNACRVGLPLGVWSMTVPEWMPRPIP